MPTLSKPYIQVSEMTLKTPLGPVYQDVSFQANKGQVIALFGSEGSGKTALLLTLCGRMKAGSGSAVVDGCDLKKDYKKIRRASNITLVDRVNDVPANTRVEDILSAELQVVGRSGRKAKVDEYLRNWKLDHLKGTKFCDLECYEKKFFDIALACAGDPAILMVDDIQDGLTQHQSIRVMNHLKNLAYTRGMTILVGIGEYDIARYADGIVVLSASAERQRQAVLRERGEAMLCPVLGTGNGVQLGLATKKPVAGEGVNND